MQTQWARSIMEHHTIGTCVGQSMEIHLWLQHYGYLALTVGSLIEGDVFMLAGAFLARQGHFSWQTVFLIGITTAVVHGQLCFYPGRRFGQSLLARLPVLHARSQRIRALLHRRQRMLIVFYRLIFGLRTAAPILIGISDVSPRRFLLLNTLGALLWSGCYTALGYLLGQAAELLIGKLKHDALWMVLAVVLVLAVLSVYYALHGRSERHD